MFINVLGFVTNSKLKMVLTEEIKQIANKTANDALFTAFIMGDYIKSTQDSLNEISKYPHKEAGLDNLVISVLSSPDFKYHEITTKGKAKTFGYDTKLAAELIYELMDDQPKQSIFDNKQIVERFSTKLIHEILLTNRHGFNKYIEQDIKSVYQRNKEPKTFHKRREYLQNSRLEAKELTYKYIYSISHLSKDELSDFQCSLIWLEDFLKCSVNKLDQTKKDVKILERLIKNGRVHTSQHGSHTYSIDEVVDIISHRDEYQLQNPATGLTTMFDNLQFPSKINPLVLTQFLKGAYTFSIKNRTKKTDTNLLQLGTAFFNRLFIKYETEFKDWEVLYMEIGKDFRDKGKDLLFNRIHFLYNVRNELGKLSKLESLKAKSSSKEDYQSSLESIQKVFEKPLAILGDYAWKNYRSAEPNLLNKYRHLSNYIEARKKNYIQRIYNHNKEKKYKQKFSNPVLYASAFGLFAAFLASTVIIRNNYPTFSKLFNDKKTNSSYVYEKTQPETKPPTNEDIDAIINDILNEPEKKQPIRSALQRLESPSSYQLAKETFSQYQSTNPFGEPLKVETIDFAKTPGHLLAPEEIEATLIRKSLNVETNLVSYKLIQKYLQNPEKLSKVLLTKQSLTFIFPVDSVIDSRLMEYVKLTKKSENLYLGVQLTPQDQLFNKTGMKKSRDIIKKLPPPHNKIHVLIYNPSQALVISELRKQLEPIIDPNYFKHVNLPGINEI